MKANTRLVSVMVPVKKDRENIMHTYQSLQGILGNDVELVVQDHKGLCNLREVISDPNVVILEEDDKSIPHANNLASEHANGKYLMFWGAGERAVMPGFGKAVENLKANPVDVQFNAIRLFPHGYVGVAAPENIQNSMQCLTPGAMISKELFFKCGRLDTKYPIATDYALFVNLLKSTTNYVVTHDVVVDFPITGVSSQLRAFEGYVECELIRMRAYNKHPILAALDLIATCQAYLKQHAQISDARPQPTELTT